ncbi:hypothetical protein HK103_004257 [Boothiomyces macroporosus]|uniref:Nudix hydrolase domain-containing protein n=1 Tax=Boothiomyces macroporosus TaxID=261099 RepID=A0AAD5UKL3_9FUNG|nr:hypothetical protein HK103_004257 [Boothiomyces macroporosus]
MLKLVKKYSNYQQFNPIPLKYKSETIGHIQPKMVPHLPSFFQVEQNEIILLTNCTETIEKMLLEWKAKGLFKCLKGWRNERYNVYGSDSILFEIERSANTLLGIRGYGCHMNGYILDNDQVKVWIGKRSLNKQTFPGLTVGYTPLECMVKEAWEEAGISKELCKDMVQTSCISFWRLDEYESEPATNYVFDLQLPNDFVPKQQDDEVDSFRLLEIPEIKELILKEKFKPEAALVMIDFMVRKGFLNDEEGFLELVTRLRVLFDYPGPK